MQKVVLAYSGGLDTSFCVKYLSQDLGYEVHAVLVQTGGFSEAELQATEARAHVLGVASFKVLDVTQAYYQDIIRYLVYGNVLKNNTYPLSVSAERVMQAKAVADYARSIGAQAVAHGSTGAGNDQVRFDMAFAILAPGVEVITPIRTLRLSREAEIAYLQERGVQQDWTKAAYSINKGLWGTSVGGKETLTSHQPLPESAWPTQITKHTPEQVSLHFQKGELVGLNGETLASVEAIRQLQALAQPFGIGRDVHVGDTIIGIKGRVGFEAAAPLIIIKAHHLLEKHTLSKHQLGWKEQAGTTYGNLLHEGHYHEPLMRNLETFLVSTQDKVTGVVHVLLRPYHFELLGIESPHDLHGTKHGSYGEMNLAWTGEDVKGFTVIEAVGSSIYKAVNS